MNAENNEQTDASSNNTRLIRKTKQQKVIFVNFTLFMLWAITAFFSFKQLLEEKSVGIWFILLLILSTAVVFIAIIPVLKNRKKEPNITTQN